MKVLITGGYGFIGSFVAEMFHAEGHHIYILDNLATGNKNNIHFKHEFFQLNAEDPKCADIFEKFRFDVVIHLAAQVDVGVSMVDPYKDSKYNVMGLSNILHLSKRYGVGKVVFASSAAVYGLNKQIPLTEESDCDPISPYGVNKLIGELYCNKWKDIYGLDTLCFRFSNVFGPKQGGAGEGGVISTFTKRVIQGKELVVHGDGEQTRDFIYVQDVAEAIYRGVKSNLTGIYNLSTNTEISINQIIKYLHGLGNIKDVVYKEPKKGDIKHSRLDNSRLKKDLGLAPLHTFYEGLEKTYHWFNSEKLSEPKNEKKASDSAKKWMGIKSIFPYFENLALLLLIYVLSSFIENSLYMIDYQLVYIIMASILLSKFQSLLSIGLGSAWFIIESITAGRNPVSLLIDPDSLIHISLFIFAGLAIRYVLDKKERMLDEYQNEANVTKQKYQALSTVYQDTLMEKEQMQDQILYTNNSVGTVYSIMKELDTLELEKIYQSSINIVEDMLNTNKAAFYLYNPTHNSYKLAAHSESFTLHSFAEIEQKSYLSQVIKTHEPFINKNLNENLPSMVVPVVVDGHSAGVVCIHELEFEYLSLFYINLMKVITELIGSSLSLAYQHHGITIGKKIGAYYSVRKRVTADA